jgi:uncharacterized protein
MSIGLIIIGALTGFISAFFGIGGSSIDTPILRLFFGFSPYLALATPLPLALLTATSAYLVYGRKNYFKKNIAGLCLLGGIPGMLIGSYLSKFISGGFLMFLTAAILFFVGLDFIYKRLSGSENYDHHMEKKSRSTFFSISVASGIGLLSGILANGGGIFFVPAFVIFFGMKMKEAIATSLIVVAAMAIPGSIVHYGLGHVDLASTAAIGLGAVPMAWLGAKADIHTKSDTLKLLFGLLLVSFSVYFFLSQI